MRGFPRQYLLEQQECHWFSRMIRIIPMQVYT